MKDPTPLLNFVATVFAAAAAWHLYVVYTNPVATSDLMIIQLGNATVGIGAAIVSSIFYATAAIISAMQRPPND